ncbi:MarR family winged helix-turn-helix transcriptional regulator [Asticcacaulis sp. AND118]|uniref:MarR family winged helix-turn-helix transcriptional regulator n=1 Tax=Asticcacaulis sp. AND118 TaxID=2840468 RepID=UPI001CFF71AD|nr:MarR family transcriptional regulator [Asticcacaulis sp. AND118]UDF03697.1 MarR family transcriptional regulator [Asticcacaulis sp. AND118]
MKKHKRNHFEGSDLLENSPSHLLHRVLQIALDIYTEETGDSALTQRQYALLLAADSTEGLTQTDLVKATGIDRSTLADMVARLITKGLLERERSATDARANLVRLSDEGRAALSEIRPKVEAADERILSLLSPPKRDSFLKLLRRIAAVREEDAVDAPKVKGEKKGDKKKKGKKAGKKHKEPLPFPALNEGVTPEKEDA